MIDIYSIMGLIPRCLQRSERTSLRVDTPQLAVLKRDFDDHNTDEYVTFIDKHYRKGNIEKPYCGFNGCKLALVLYHNTPNNSFPVLWHGWEKKGEDILAQKSEALFPRVTRHKES